MVTSHRAVFLDRDGVLNRTDVRNGKPYAPKRLEDFELLLDAAAALSRLKDAGFRLVVVTNQPDVGNGDVDISVVDAMHEQLLEGLPIDSIKTCYHAQHEGCACRKPKPGMLLEAATELDLDMKSSFMVGDRKGDIEAGQAVDCFSIFIDRDYRAAEKPDNPDSTARSLNEAVNTILANTTNVS